MPDPDTTPHGQITPTVLETVGDDHPTRTGNQVRDAVSNATTSLLGSGALRAGITPGAGAGRRDRGPDRRRDHARSTAMTDPTPTQEPAGFPTVSRYAPKEDQTVSRYRYPDTIPRGTGAPRPGWPAGVRAPAPDRPRPARPAPCGCRAEGEAVWLCAGHHTALTAHPAGGGSR